MDLDIPFIDSLERYWAGIAAELDLRFIFSVLVTPFLNVIKFFANLRIDYSFVKVTCIGASSPYELGVNMVILGTAVLIIGSDIQVFKQVSLGAYLTAKGSIVTKPLYAMWHLKQRGNSLTFAFCAGGLKYIAVRVRVTLRHIRGTENWTTLLRKYHLQMPLYL